MIHHSHLLSRLGRQVRNGRESTNWGSEGPRVRSYFVDRRRNAATLFFQLGLETTVGQWDFIRAGSRAKVDIMGLSTGQFPRSPLWQGDKKSPFRVQSMTLPLHSGESVSPWAADKLPHA